MKKPAHSKADSIEMIKFRIQRSKSTALQIIAVLFQAIQSTTICQRQASPIRQKTHTAALESSLIPS